MTFISVVCFFLDISVLTVLVEFFFAKVKK